MSTLSSPLIAQTPRSAWLLLWGWILASAGAAGAAALLGQFLEDIVLGLALASAQTLVLRWYRLPHAGWWVPASTVGSLTGWLVAVVFLALVPGQALGAGLGSPWWAGAWGGGALFQAWVLAAGPGRRPRRLAMLWVLASLAGGLLFRLVADSAGGFMFQLRDVWTPGSVGAMAARQLADHVLAWSGGGALYGLVTGAVLPGLVHRRHRQR